MELQRKQTDLCIIITRAPRLQKFIYDKVVRITFLYSIGNNLFMECMFILYFPKNIFYNLMGSDYSAKANILII
jgi:hypothetical protein